MKICLIAPYINRSGGTEKCFAELIERLPDEHQVTVLANKIEDIPTGSFKTIKVPMIKKPGILAFLSFFIINNILFLKHKGDFDIVHSSGGDSLFSNVVTFHFCEAERKRLLKEKLIKISKCCFISLLRKIHYQFYSTVVGLFERITARRNTIISFICVSENVKRNIAFHYGLPADRIKVIYNGTEIPDKSIVKSKSSKFRIREALGISNNFLVFLFVGGDWERKGLLNALTAFSLMNRKDCIFIVLGRGDKKFYARECNKLGIGAKTMLLGHRKDVESFYHASDIFVFPSIYEPFGLAPLEAIANGLPIIISRTSGLAELLEDGKDSIIVNNPNDITAIKVAMELLAADSSFREQLANNALEKAKQLQWDKNIDETKKIYDKVLSEKEVRK